MSAITGYKQSSTAPAKALIRNSDPDKPNDMRGTVPDQARLAGLRFCADALIVF